MFGHNIQNSDILIKQMLCIKHNVGETMKNLMTSLELMSFQNDDFGDKLVKAIDRLRLEGSYGSKSIIDSGIEKLIKDRFGLDINFNVIRSNFIKAAVESPPLSKEHPFDQIFSANYLDNSMGRLISNIGDKANRIGSVSLKTGRLTGIFTSINHHMVVSDSVFSSGLFSSREIAAIILHEIGHPITYYYFLLNTVMGSFITAYIANAANKAKDDKERKVIFTKGARVLGIDGVAIEPLLTNTPEQNANTLQTLFINNTYNELRSETGAALYEAKVCEQLADMFAVKMGFGVELATGLEKIHRGSTPKTPKAYLFALKAISEVTLRTLQMASFGLLTPMIQMSLMSKPFDDLVSPYDNSKDRITYLKRHLIQELKNTNEVSPEFTKQLISDIEKIQTVINKVEPYESVVNYLQKKLLPFGRRVKSEQDLQKDIEGLIYNDVFVQAAKLGAMK